MAQPCLSPSTQSFAKFLISGEYAVLLGAPAIAVPIKEINLCYSESTAENTNHEFWLNDVKIVDDKHLQKLETLRNIVLNDSQISSPQKIKVEVRTSIPIGKGLGSSAALGVAMARFHHPQKSKKEIAELALQGETLFHGNPSGVDPYCISFEQPIAFTKSPKNCTELDLGLLKKSELVFVLRDSGGTHSTSEQLKVVMNQESLILELAKLSQEMLDAIMLDCSKIGSLMNRIHERLRLAGASSPQIENNIQELLSMGALGAKLTGSGRGGFVIAVFEKNDFAKLPLTFGTSTFYWQPA